MEEQNERKAERRACRRAELCLPVELYDRRGGQRLASGRTVDVSAGGLLVECPELNGTHVGQQLQVRVGLAQQAWPHRGGRFEARVVRVDGPTRCALCALGEPPQFLLFPELIGLHPSILELKRGLLRILDHDVNVLVQGESGTGKNLVASLIHRYSRRRTAPCIRVNCPAIPDTLLESQLFGYEKGAFTDARSAQPGLLRMADRGVVVFDEISAIPFSMQAKLLQLLEEKRFIPVGARGPVEVDVRIVATSNDQLPQRIRDGAFREDLYYRLNEVTLQLPPLRERKDDLPLLADYLVHVYCQRFRRQYRPLDPDTIRMLMRYNWPGNVRELENTIMRGVLMGQFDRIDGPTPPPQPVAAPPDAAALTDPPSAGVPSLREAREAAERQALMTALIESDYNRTAAAARLGVSYQTLLRRMKKYKIEL